MDGYLVAQKCEQVVQGAVIIMCVIHIVYSIQLGCPPRFVQIIRSFHDGMFCRVIENGDASDPFPVSNGVKQGCVLAPTLFSLLFAQMLSAALSQTEAGVKIHYRTDGDFFNLRRLKSYTKVTRAIV